METTIPTRYGITRLAPALLARIDTLNGCQGRWLIDVEDVPRGPWTSDTEDASNTHRLPVAADNEQGWAWFDATAAAEATGYGVGSLELAAFYCAQTGWAARLIFSAGKLNADCCWPGGYDQPSIYRSNNRVFKEEYKVELELAETSHEGLALDVRFCTDAMAAAIAGLEDYPLLSEDDHSEFKAELQEEAWSDGIESDWRGEVEKALQAYAPEGYNPYWADERLEAVETAIGAEPLQQRLRELFHACCEQANAHWGECDGCQRIDVARVATALDRADLVELTGLPLLAPDQEWRREPYPWPGAAPSPLAPALPV